MVQGEKMATDVTNDQIARIESVLFPPLWDAVRSFVRQLTRDEHHLYDERIAWRMAMFTLAVHWPGIGRCWLRRLKSLNRSSAQSSQTRMP